MTDFIKFYVKLSTWLRVFARCVWGKEDMSHMPTDSWI